VSYSEQPRSPTGWIKLSSGELPEEGKVVPIMAYFGSCLREFAGYWVSPPAPEPTETEAEPEPAAPEWRTSSGNKLTWVEAWYSVPAYTPLHIR
jgi:hypothetical protein